MFPVVCSVKMSNRVELQPEAKYEPDTGLDPLEKLVPDVYDLIFQHLTGSDVKNCFAVSTLWNQALSTSSKTVSKLKLVLINENTKSLSPEDARILCQSKRQYKHAEIMVSSNREMSRKMSILKEISESLENLEVRGNWHFNLIFPTDVKLPKLKTLKLSSLKTEEIQSILRWIPACLLQLKINKRQNKSLFSSPIPPITAKLTSLDIEGLNLDSRQSEQHLKDFLGPMSSSLKSLSIPSYNHSNLEFIIEEMKSLEVLSICSDQLVAAFVTRNQTIRTLKLRMSIFHEDDLFINLSSIENLQTLQMDWCQKEKLENVLRQCKDGQLVQIGEWYGIESPHAVYENLIQSDRSVARNITVVFDGAD
jgi:hypothetical protein